MTYFNNKSVPGWIFVTAILALMVVFQLLDIRVLRYQSNWWGEGEYWRSLSAHWVHANWPHFLLNATGLVLCITIASPKWSNWRWIAYNLYIGFGISTLFTLRNPELGWYVGYSGILFGIYFLAAIDLFTRDRIIALLLGAAIVIKVVLEQTSEIRITSADLIKVPVIVDAHLYGLLLALSIALAERVYTIWVKHEHAETNSG